MQKEVETTTAEELYEPPCIIELGDAAELTLGKRFFDCLDDFGMTRACP
jgi:hypothetical protein